MAQVTQENIKEKVQRVREVVPQKSNNEIVMVLQYYDYSVEDTIQAFLEDGAKSALQEWHYPGNKPPNKRKKKANKNKSAAGQDQKTAAGSSGGAGGRGDASALESTATVTVPTVSVTDAKSGSTHKVISTSSTSGSSGKGQEAQKLGPAAARGAFGAPSKPTPNVPAQYQQRPKSLYAGDQQAKGSSSQPTPSLLSPLSPGTQRPHAGLEKSLKDLQRQTISLQRLTILLSETSENDAKKMKKVFEELHNELNDREAVLMFEMDKAKTAAMNTLVKRQKLASELKTRTDRAPSMQEKELRELRADIKHFVTDRKIDEDLGKSNLFVCDEEKITQDVKTFGTVPLVKQEYSTRRPSISSVTSSTVNDDVSAPTTPSTPLLHPVQLSVPSNSLPMSITSSSLSPQELAELQQRLQNSLKLQGLASKSPPSRASNPSRPHSGQSGGRPQNNQGSRPYSSQSAVKQQDKTSEKRVQQQQVHSDKQHKTSSPTRPQGSPVRGNAGRSPGYNKTNQNDGPDMKSKTARRRQRERDRKREQRQNLKEGASSAAKSQKDIPEEAGGTKPSSGGPSSGSGNPGKSSHSTETIKSQSFSNQNRSNSSNFRNKPAEKGNVGPNVQQGGRQRTPSPSKYRQRVWSRSRDQDKQSQHQAPSADGKKKLTPENRMSKSAEVNQNHASGEGEAKKMSKDKREVEVKTATSEKTVSKDKREVEVKIATSDKTASDVQPKVNAVKSVSNDTKINHINKVDSDSTPNGIAVLNHDSDSKAPKKVSVSINGCNDANMNVINGDAKDKNAPVSAEPLPQRKPREKVNRDSVVKTAHVTVNGEVNHKEMNGSSIADGNGE